jgi:ribonuclease Z
MIWRWLTDISLLSQLDPPPHHAVNVICNRMNRFALDDYQAIERHRDSKDHKLAFIDSANADMHGPPLDEVPADGRRYRAYTDSALNSLCSATGFEQISTVSVSHRSGHCYGIVLRHSEGWSIAYSGDTMPCANMVDAAKDVTVLIHEATIEDDQPEMAAMKGHSTFGQAIQVANEAGAECCLLTHFSQRYPKLARLSKPEQPSDSLAKSPLIGLAFDLMSVSLADFWKLQHYQPAIEALYAGEEELNSKTSNQTSSAREVISAKNAAAAAAASGEKLLSTRSELTRLFVAQEEQQAHA